MEIICVILIAASAAYADYTGSSSDYGDYHFRHFAYNNDHITFGGAMSRCTNYADIPGGFVAVTKDSNINSIVAQTCNYHQIWLGGGDFAAESYYEWIDGSPWYYSNWESGEPNNANGAEDCLMQNHKQVARWNDVPCGIQLGYVCQFLKSNMRRFGSSELTVYKHEQIATYSEAKTFCKRRSARLVELKNMYDHQDLFRKLDNNDAIEYWIEGQEEGKCAVVSPSGIKMSDCGERLSFICEAVEPNGITVSHEGSSVQEHTDLDIDCAASGYPVPEVTWYVGRDLLPNQTTGNGRSTLHLRDLRVKDSGMYTCHAKNVILGKQHDLRGFTILDVTPQDADDN